MVNIGLFACRMFSLEEGSPESFSTRPHLLPGRWGRVVKPFYPTAVACTKTGAPLRAGLATDWDVPERSESGHLGHVYTKALSVPLPCMLTCVLQAWTCPGEAAPVCPSPASRKSSSIQVASLLVWREAVVCWGPTWPGQATS